MSEDAVHCGRDLPGRARARRVRIRCLQRQQQLPHQLEGKHGRHVGQAPEPRRAPPQRRRGAQPRGGARLGELLQQPTQQRLHVHRHQHGERGLPPGRSGGVAVGPLEQVSSEARRELPQRAALAIGRLHAEAVADGIHKRHEHRGLAERGSAT